MIITRKFYFSVLLYKPKDMEEARWKLVRKQIFNGIRSYKKVLVEHEEITMFIDNEEKTFVVPEGFMVNPWSLFPDTQQDEKNTFCVMANANNEKDFPTAVQKAEQLANFLFYILKKELGCLSKYREFVTCYAIIEETIGSVGRNTVSWYADNMNTFQPDIKTEEHTYYKLILKNNNKDARTQNRFWLSYFLKHLNLDLQPIITGNKYVKKYISDNITAEEFNKILKAIKVNSRQELADVYQHLRININDVKILKGF